MRNKKWEIATHALTKLNQWKRCRPYTKMIWDVLNEIMEDERVAVDKENSYQEFKSKYAEAMKVASDYMTERGRLMGERTRALQDRDTLERLVMRAIKYREPEE